MLVKDLLIRARKTLQDSRIESLSDSDFLLAYVCDCKVSELLPFMEVSEDKMRIFDSLITRRCQHEPMDSLIGYTEFLGLKIPFHRETLSPRQETEIMVDTIIAENRQGGKYNVLDMCTGSGCIGLAIAKHMQAEVTLVDISDDAIRVANNNARLNNVTATIIKSNLFDNITTKFDIIISNPPYIPTLDCEGLEDEVKFFDPILALDGGEDGLDFYRKIITESPKHLNDGGLIYLESGINQSEDIVNLLTKDFEDIKVFKDYAGIDRFIRAKLK